MKLISLIAVIALGLLVVGCVGQQEESSTSREEGEVAPHEAAAEPVAGFELMSPAFEHEGMIPAKYTCDGENISPPLAWGDPPEGAQSFALVMDDPDAAEVGGKVWVHWLLYNLPADARSLPENVGRDIALYPGARAGKGDSGNGYGGPCPPAGRLHHYHFKLFALDTDLGLEAGLRKAGLVTAIEGHVLAKAELVGRYSRRD